MFSRILRVVEVSGNGGLHTQTQTQLTTNIVDLHGVCIVFTCLYKIICM